MQNNPVESFYFTTYPRGLTWSAFSFAEAGCRCIPTVLLILKEVAESYTPDDDNKQEDASNVILGVVANIFQKIIELLARRLKKEPEEAKLVWRH